MQSRSLLVVRASPCGVFLGWQLPHRGPLFAALSTWFLLQSGRCIIANIGTTLQARLSTPTGQGSYASSSSKRSKSRKRHHNRRSLYTTAVCLEPRRPSCAELSPRQRRKAAAPPSRRKQQRGGCGAYLQRPSQLARPTDQRALQQPPSLTASPELSFLVSLVLARHVRSRRLACCPYF